MNKMKQKKSITYMTHTSIKEETYINPGPTNPEVEVMSSGSK